MCACPHAHLWLGVREGGLLGKSGLAVVGPRAVVRQVEYRVGRVVRPGGVSAWSTAAASHLVGKVFPAGPTGVRVPCHFTARSCNCQHGSTLIFTPMPPGCLGLPPRAHLRPGPSWSHYWCTRVTASPGPGTAAKPPTAVAGMRHVGREVCSWPLAPLTDVDTPPAPSAAHTHGDRPSPPVTPPCPTPPPYHQQWQEPQRKPRSITAAARSTSHSPSGGRKAGIGRPQVRPGGRGAAGESRQWWGHLRRKKLVVEASSGQGCYYGQKVCPGGQLRWPDCARARAAGSQGAGVTALRPAEQA